MDTISFDDFAKCDIRVGRFVSVEPVSGSAKLYKELVDFGEQIGQRQILSGLQKFYTPDELIGKLGLFIINLKPRKIMNLESQGMLLAVDGKDRPILLTVDSGASVGARVR